MSGSLKKENFRVSEDGKEPTIDSLYFAGNASGHILDLAIVFDGTSSMDEEISAMKSKANDLIQSINSSNLDARYFLAGGRINRSCLDNRRAPQESRNP